MKFNNHTKLAILAIFIAFSACKKIEIVTPKKEDVSDLKTLVKTASPSTGDKNNAIEVLAIVTSDKEAKPSFKTGGVISKTFLKEGDVVKKGQLLATLVMSEINAQVNQAEIAFSKAKRDLERVKNLHADSVATLEQLQNVTTAYEVSQKTLDIAKFNKQYSEVRSPIKGRIVKQIMNDGEITGPGTPIYAIIGTGSADWKINAGLIDRDWARVEKGDAASVVLDAFPDKKFECVVSEKSIIGGNANSTIDVELKFKNTPPNLAAGLLGKVSIFPKTVNKNNLSIPIEALTKSNGSSAIVYLLKDGKAVKTSIQIGRILGENVEVTSGILASDIVITVGSMYVEDGDEVVVEK